MPFDSSLTTIKNGPAFVAWVLNQVVGRLQEQGFVLDHAAASGEKLAPVLAPFCHDAHMSYCSRCGFVGVVTGWSNSSINTGTHDDDPDLDLTNPDHLHVASVHQIRFMNPDVRTALIPNVTAAHRSMLDAPRLAALNPLNQVVPFLGDDHAPIAVPEMHAWIEEDDNSKHFTTKHSPNDRYYVITRGLKFTGVVRGSYLNTIYAAHGVSQGGAPAMNFRADAEFAWLCYFYGGECARILNAVIQPEVPIFA